MPGKVSTRPPEAVRAATGTRYGGFGGQAKRLVRERTLQGPGNLAKKRPGRRTRAGWAIAAVLGMPVLVVAPAACRAWMRGVQDEARARAYWAGVHHDGPVAPLEALHGEGRVYLVQMGAPQQPYGPSELAGWLRAKYGLDVQVLSPAPLDRAAWDPDRQQYVAELLDEELARAYPALEKEPNAALIGITDESMYRAHSAGEVNYTTRLNEHLAVVSSYGFEEHGFLQRRLNRGRGTRPVAAMLRSFVLKDVALLHWHLEVNNDLTSLLQDNLTPDLPAEDIYASDLDPEARTGGAAMNNPCLYFTYSAAAGVQPMSGAALRTCTQESRTPQDESQEVIEVDLIAGVVRDARMDLSLPDSVPIAFERILRPGGTNPTEFGVSGSHSYDKYLWAQSMTMLHLVGPEFLNANLRRVPWWLPVESLNHWVDADYSGRLSTMNYHLLPRERFDLKDLHGNVESYLPCDGPVPCYLDGVRNAQGQELHFERGGKDRKLLRLTSPNGSWLKFTYDGRDRLTEVADSRGRSVHYGYNSQNQLARVTHASGEAVSYEYDGEQRLLSMSAAPDAASPPRLLLRNTYDGAGRLVRQTLAGGAVYSYVHHPVASAGTRWITVTTPDGRGMDVLSQGPHASLWSTDRNGSLHQDIASRQGP